uniref:Myb/SANT-like domain-containing protein n=1 Tax=Oryza brachyantha TaxID=4533 RepID=J3M7X3_ORYBR
MGGGIFGGGPSDGGTPDGDFLYGGGTIDGAAGFGATGADGAYAAGSFTRDFLASGPWSSMVAAGASGSDAQNLAGSSFGPAPVGLVLNSLDLNDDHGWGDSAAFGDYDHPGGEPPHRHQPTFSFQEQGAARSGRGRLGHGSRGSAGRRQSAVEGHLGGTSPPAGTRQLKCRWQQGHSPLPLSPWGRCPRRASASDNGDDTDDTLVAKSKANWSVENTVTFCSIWYHQIDNKNYIRGVMQKNGWKDIIQRYHIATGLLHSKEQFQGRLR